MKRVVFALCFLLFVQAAAAAIETQQVFYEKLTSSGVYTGSNGEEFAITFLGDKISAGYADTTLIVDNNTCEFHGLYEFCLSITEFSHIDPDYTEGERWVSKREVTINTLLTDLNLSREIGKTEFWIGESADITMRIHNTGQRATKISFTDEFSDIFEVALPFVCDLKNNTVKWSGKLEKKQVFTCDYRIKAVKAGTFNSAAKAEFNTGVAEKTNTHVESLTVNDHPLNLQVSLSDESVGIGDVVIATFDLKTTEKIRLDSLKIVLPEGLTLLSWEGIDKLNDNTLKYTKKDLAGNFSDSFEITFRAVNTGIQAFTENAVYSILLKDQVALRFNRDIELNVSLAKAYTRLAETNFEKGKNALLVVITNPTHLNFLNVNISIDTSLPLKRKTAKYAQVDVRGHQNFGANFDAQPGNYYLTTELVYNTKYGETFVVTKTENITVTGTVEQVVEVEDETAETTEVVEQPLQEGTVTTLEPARELPVMWIIIGTVVVLMIAAAIILIRKRKYDYVGPEDL